jgi:hypothetical protein
MLRQIGQGVPLNETVNSLSIEYEVTENALYQDWKNRKRWTSDIVRLDDPDSFIMELMDFLNWLRQRSALEVLQGDSTSNRVGAIRTGIDVVRTLFSIAQASGKITSQALDQLNQIEVVIRDVTQADLEKHQQITA